MIDAAHGGSRPTHSAPSERFARIDGTRTRRNIRLLIEYDGSGYHGWQRQHGVLTIQEVIESRLEIMLGERTCVRASGRTDAGVHARGQVANFYTHTGLPVVAIQRGLNSLLPPDIVILAVDDMDDSFHARFSAASKTYEYWILNRICPGALERGTSWHIRYSLDVHAMRECLFLVVGSHDFSAFMASGSSVGSTERVLYRAELDRSDEDHLVFTFEANGFLRHMVRNLVGTLVEVGSGKRTQESFAELFRVRDRRRAGMTAPAHGLYLKAVHYNGTASTGNGVGK